MLITILFLAPYLEPLPQVKLVARFRKTSENETIKFITGNFGSDNYCRMCRFAATNEGIEISLEHVQIRFRKLIYSS